MITRTRLVTPSATSSDITHLICLHDARSCTSICRHRSSSEIGCDTCGACNSRCERKRPSLCTVLVCRAIWIRSCDWPDAMGYILSRRELKVLVPATSWGFRVDERIRIHRRHWLLQLPRNQERHIMGSGRGMVINNHSNLKATQCTYCNGTNRVDFMAWNASEHTWITSGLNC